MERRNWSLELYDKLKYIDSLDDYDKAHSLQLWNDQYMSDDFLDNLDLNKDDLKNLSELFYKNIKFLKEHKDKVYTELNKNLKIKKFLN